MTFDHEREYRRVWKYECLTASNLQESILFPLLRSNVKSHSEIDKRRSNTVKKHQPRLSKVLGLSHIQHKGLFDTHTWGKPSNKQGKK